jgi:hypothetical protein
MAQKCPPRVCFVNPLPIIMKIATFIRKRLLIVRVSWKRVINFAILIRERVHLYEDPPGLL